MYIERHYVIERSPTGMFTIRPSDSDYPIERFYTLRLALDHVRQLNPDDVPEIVPSLIDPRAA